MTAQAIPTSPARGAAPAPRRRAPWVQHSILPGFGLSLGITLAYLGAIVVLPIFYGILGAVLTAISAVLYNIVAGMIGGIQIEVDMAGPAGSTSA